MIWLPDAATSRISSIYANINQNLGGNYYAYAIKTIILRCNGCSHLFHGISVCRLCRA